MSLTSFGICAFGSGHRILITEWIHQKPEAFLLRVTAVSALKQQHQYSVQPVIRVSALSVTRGYHNENIVLLQQ